MLVEIVAAFMFSLNVTVTVTLAATLIAPFVGLTEVTVGLVVSDELLVLNVDVNVVASALPATSLTRGSVVPPKTLSRYVVDEDRVEFGVTVAMRLAALKVTVRAIRAVVLEFLSSIVLVEIVL